MTSAEHLKSWTLPCKNKTLSILSSRKWNTFWLMIKIKFTLLSILRDLLPIFFHLPSKNFKMVNRYGFYSRNISGRLKETIDALRKNIAVSRYSFYQRQMYRTFGMNPFYCPACKVKMIVWEFYHYRYPPLKKYY